MKIIFLFIFTLVGVASFAEEVKVISGSYESERDMERLDNFEVSKGDQITLNIDVDHKRRGIEFQMWQYPGQVCVMYLSDINNGSYTVTATADAIYECWYGGKKCEVSIDIKKITDKPNGPERGKIQYIRKSDTVHVGKYVDRFVGTNYDLVPHKEKVAIAPVKTPEKVIIRNFFTGQDRIDLPIAGDRKYPYKTQKLLNVELNLFVETPTMFATMNNVADAAIEEFVPDWTDFLGKLPTGKGKNKGADMSKFVEVEEISKKEKAINATIEVADYFRAEHLDKDAFKGAVYIASPDSMAQIEVTKGLRTAGAPEGVISITNTVFDIPSTSDLLTKGLDKIVSQVKGRAYLALYCRKVKEYTTVNFPDKEFFIQSAKEYGKSTKGCIYISGDDNKGKDGLNIKVKEGIDQNDRKWKVKPASNQPGYHNIVSMLPGDKSYVFDNQGGDSKMMDRGHNLHLWSKNGGKGQAFYFNHLGGGKFQIINHDGFVVCLEGRSSENGNNIHFWEPQDGDHTEFYLLDPVTKQKFVPTSSQLVKKKIDRNFHVIGERGGVIKSRYVFGRETDKLDLDKDVVHLTIIVEKEKYESPAKLIVDANYLVTDYIDAIKYDKVNQNQYCKDFQTAFKVYYSYDIVFSDMVKDHHVAISENEFYSKKRAASERQNSDNLARLNRFNVLNQATNSQASK